MLTRSLAALALVAALSATATAHFVFIVPESANKARVVFSDSLAPDKNVSVEKIAGTTLLMRDARGKASPKAWALVWTKGENSYAIEIPGTGSRVVYGVTDYGVVQKGSAKPYLLRYYPKALVGPIPEDGGKLGKHQDVEIVPVVSGGKVAFEVLAHARPVADAEVHVLQKSGAEKLITDAKGRTKAVEVKGQCGVYVRHVEKKAGKVGGKDYDEVRQYATLVFDPAGK
jgi:uncharacterized GH25 family protein